MNQPTSPEYSNAGGCSDCEPSPSHARGQGQQSYWRDAAVWASGRVGGVLQELRGNRCTHGFGVLMYHRIAELPSGIAPPTINVTPQRLRQQLSGLLSRGFKPCPLTELVEAHRNGTAIPSNLFAVTFDDGYENNFTAAWPILRELNIPATIFLASQYLDSGKPFPFEEWSAAGSRAVAMAAWRPLSTSQCRELLSSGLVALGAHTHSHERFLGRPAAFRSDLATCLAVLRDRLGLDRPMFAFPFGDFDAELVRVASQLNVLGCMTTRHRRVNPGDDSFVFGRFNVECSDTAAVLAAKLSGWRSSVAAVGERLVRPLASLARRRQRFAQRPQDCAAAAAGRAGFRT
jgi:peptidoglycan/xylan/chitin deacetylase (PgdA/CDA1 family)